MQRPLKNRPCRLFLLLGLVLWCGCNRGEIPEFDGPRAMQHLIRQCEFGPRVPNTLASDSCRQYLVATLEPLADSVSEQRFVHEFTNGDSLPLVNILARFAPWEGERILLVAHYDSRPRADYDPDPARRDDPILGANDGASGVAVLLEVARCLAQSTPPLGVDILLTDGEDWGESGHPDDYLLGARYFASHRPCDHQCYKLGILLDLVGEKGARFLREEYSQRFARKSLDEVWGKARDHGLTAFIDSQGPSVFDDHIPLLEVGIPIVNIIDFDYPYWHTHGDTPDKCSEESLQSVGDLVLAVIYD